MPVIKIEDVAGLPQLQTMYQWSVKFSPPKSISNSMTPDQIDLRCVSSGLPTLTNQDMEVNIRGHKLLQAGQGDFGNEIEMTFVETIKAEISELIQAWQKDKWDAENGTQSARADHEVDVTLDMLDNKGNITQTYVLKHASVKAANFGELGGDTNEVQKPSVTFSYMYHKWSKGSGGGGAKS